MENQLDQLKNELVRDIKELATEIAKSNSFVGLISQEIKFKTLHEKFINLKFLERKNIGLDIFDQPIPVQDFFEDEDSNEEEFFTDEVFEKVMDAIDKEEVFDAIIASYHDQGLIPFKTLAFGKGVNYTAGLNRIRTSPDHGTAFDLAGKNQANFESFRQAIYTAISIFEKRAEYQELTKNPLQISRKKAYLKKKP